MGMGKGKALHARGTVALFDLAAYDMPEGALGRLQRPSRRKEA